MSEIPSASVSPTPTPAAPTETQPSAPSPQAATPKAEPEIYEVKINGKTHRMTRQEVISQAALGSAAQQRFEEAAKTKKAAERIIQSAKANPIQALMDPELGLSKEQIRDYFEKWYHQEFIEPEALTPEQKKSKDLERQLEKYRAAEKEQKEKLEKEAQDQLTNQQRDYLQNQIIQAMEQSGLPKTAHFAKRMAFYMRQNLMNGWEAPIDLIVNQVKKEHQESTSEVAKASTVEQLIALFGEDVVNKIRKYDLENLRKKRNIPPPTPSDPSYPSPNQPRKKISSDEVNRRLTAMRLGKL